jgi:hypothetical protein
MQEPSVRFICAKVAKLLGRGDPGTGESLFRGRAEIRDG